MRVLPRTAGLRAMPQTSIVQNNCADVAAQELQCTAILGENSGKRNNLPKEPQAALSNISLMSNTPQYCVRATLRFKYSDACVADPVILFGPHLFQAVACTSLQYASHNVTIVAVAALAQGCTFCHSLERRVMLAQRSNAKAASGANHHGGDCSSAPQVLLQDPMLSPPNGLYVRTAQFASLGS